MAQEGAKAEARDAPARLSECITAAPHRLGQSDGELHLVARDATKALFDQGVQWEKGAMPFITSLLNTVMPRPGLPEERKRKRDDSDSASAHPLFPPTALDSLVLTGMDDDQMWHQLELRSAKLSRLLHIVMTNDQEGDDEEEYDDVEADEEESVESSDAESTGFAGASDLSDVDPDEVFYEPLHSEEDQQTRKEEKEREEMMNMYNVSDPELFNAIAGGEDEEEEEEDSEEEEESEVNVPPRPRHPTIDDDFFSIDDFNRQTEAEERRSMTSHANLSGEEEEDMDGLDLFSNIDDDGVDDIHYADFFDPVPYSQRKPKSRSKMEAEEHMPKDPIEEESEEEAPRKTLVRFHEQVSVRPIKKAKPSEPAGFLTEGDDEDLEADNNEDEWEDQSEEGNKDEEDEEEEDEEENEEEEEEEDDEEEEEDEGDEEEEDDEEEEVDGEEYQNEDMPATSPSADAFEAAQDETASRVAKDLFADEDAPPPTQSTYERRMAALKEEIRAYEQENVQDKDWTLMGEANVAERPADSLLEEDLEFERTAKLAPAVTQEETEEIEAMIKRRILEKQFDDVIRQREIDPLPFVPSHLLELSDAKSSKSLAELYEDEYQSAREAAEGGMPRAESDVKLEREHSVIAADIEALFGKLDALSNAHYTPKAPKAAIETLSNTAAIEMENSLPTTMSTGTMLAPEEVYTASTHGAAMTGAKSEMTPQEKRRLHNQLRQSKRKRNDRIKRSRDAFDLSRGAPRRENTHEEKDKALKSLVGNKGVSVVGKDSKRQSVKEAVSGKKQKTQATQSPAGSQWKL